MLKKFIPIALLLGMTVNQRMGTCGTRHDWRVMVSLLLSRRLRVSMVLTLKWMTMLPCMTCMAEELTMHQRAFSL